MNEVIRAANMTVTPENTYTDERGSVLCKKCGEPRVKIIDGVRLPVICSCMRREDEERAKQQKRIEVRSRVEACSLYDAAYGTMTFEADDAPDSEASRISRAFVREWAAMKSQGYGLIFAGSVGTGKSFYAAAIVNAVIEQGTQGIIVTTTRLINEIQAAKSPGTVIDELNAFPLVALDDLGAERNTDYAVEQLEAFVNARSLSKKPLLVTTNLSGKELRKPPDMRYERIYDRVLAMCPRQVVLVGESRRVGQRVDRAAEMLRLMGV